MNKKLVRNTAALLALAGIGLFLVGGVGSPPRQATPCSERVMVHCLLYINPQGKPIPNSFAGDFDVKGELMAGKLMVDGEIMAGQAMVTGEITAGELMVRGEITTMDLMVQDTLMVGMGTVTINENDIDFGPGANDHLDAAIVSDLTDGGETNLHTHAEGAHNHDAAYLNDDQQEFMSANPGSFSAVLNVQHTGSGPGIGAISVQAEDYGLRAYTPNGYGIWSQSDGSFSRAVYATSFQGTGVWAEGGKYGVYGNGGQYGVYGYSSASNGYGVYGVGKKYGVVGSGTSGIWGVATGLATDAFGVMGESKNGYGVLGYSNNGIGVYGVGKITGVRASSFSGLPLKVEGNVGTNLIEARDVGTFPDNLRFKVERASGNVRADGTFSSPASDFAEMMAADSSGYAPGDILVISPLNPRQVSLSTEAYSTSVIGVYSTKPGFLGGYNDEVDQGGLIPVAISGIVPVKVTAENGAIQPGDLLTTSATPGHAMLASPVTVDGISFYLPGTILGKALEGLEEGTGVILVLVTLQ